jgi:catechol 2,3-dioxygenase-like lactoylglutathione lyase family enzyme
MKTRVSSSTHWELLRARIGWSVLFAAVAVLVAVTAMGAGRQATKPLAPVRMPPDLLPERPPIVGIAHIGLKVSDLDTTRQFYGHVLGYDEPFRVNNPDGSLAHTYFKVNDHQYIEIFPALKSPTEDRLSHIAFETTDSQALRDYLAVKGVKVPDRVKPGNDGNLNFTVTDPDGHRVEFCQYMPGSMQTSNFGKFLPETRISDHIQHVGITIKDRAAADKFYKNILGFRVGWYGGATDQRTDYVNMVVPEGHDWVEYMLNVDNNPTPRQLGGKNHMSLRVPSIQAGASTVAGRGYKVDAPNVGRSGKWQVSLYDPDLTRVELMEPKPVKTPCCSIMPDWQ